MHLYPRFCLTMTQQDPNQTAAETHRVIQISVPMKMMTALESQANIQGKTLEEWIAEVICELAEESREA